MLIPLDGLIRKHKLEIHGVIHLGAHTGEEHGAYQAAGVKDVLWVEGDPKVFEKLVVELGDQPRYAFINAVVSSTDGETVTFHIANNEESSSILEFGTHSVEHPDVEFVDKWEATTRTVDSIVWDQWHKSEYAYANFMNIDLQGAELLALKGAHDTLFEIDYIYTEVNTKELYVGCVLLGDLDQFLGSYGFRRVETSMTKHGWGDALYVRKP